MGIPTGAELLERMMFIVPLLLSLTVHEWAHAYSAFLLGDDTAARMGRLTLNPIPHIDPFGTILCPLLGIPFGWAKPVPITPTRFRRDVSMRAGIMITAAAGPASNVVLAVVVAVVYGLLLRFGVLSLYDPGGAQVLILRGIELNLALFVFNLLPIPPLDGSRVADGLMPYRLRHVWEEFTRYSWVALLAVIILGGSLLAVPITWLDGHLRELIVFIAER
jgi:Zn-dependent protease